MALWTVTLESDTTPAPASPRPEDECSTGHRVGTTSVLVGSDQSSSTLKGMKPAKAAQAGDPALT